MQIGPLKRIGQRTGQIAAGGALGGAALTANQVDAAAQDILDPIDIFEPEVVDPIDAAADVASAGTGGLAVATANGGAILVGDIDSGGNVGTAIGVGDTLGDVWVDGGELVNTTDLLITADGGVAIADASGGDYNVAFVS